MPELVSNHVQVHPYRRRGDTVEHLLLLRSRHDRLCPGIWQVVTGTMNPGESTMEAARREVFEETGLTATVWHILPTVATFYFEPTDQIVFAPIVACEMPEDGLPVLSTEHEEYVWTPRAEALLRLEFPSHREGVVLIETLVNDGR
jgi:8-oxo-dGTP pyrophosphatase MutT (NUDIX family)